MAVTHSEIEVLFHRYSDPIGAIVALGAPVISILAMTSEWTQRTALTTFTLSPRRLRVIAAKFIAAVTLSSAVMAFCLALSGGATAIGAGLRGYSQLPLPRSVVGDIRSDFIIMLLQVIMATAFAALAGNTTVALVAYFVAPTAWGAVGEQVFGKNADWFDIFNAYGRLSDTRPLDHFNQTVTSIAVWVILPATLGVARCLRREVK